MDRLTLRKSEQAGCFVSLGLVVAGGVLFAIAQYYPSLEVVWRVLLGSGSIFGAWVFLKLQSRGLRAGREAFESQLAEFPAEATQFYKTDQGFLAVSSDGIGTSYRPTTTFWTDFSQIQGIACGQGRNVQNAWWKTEPRTLPRVEQIDEPWLLIVSDDTRGNFQFFTCPPKLEPKIWFRILKSRVEQKDVFEFPESKLHPTYLRHGGGAGDILATVITLFFCAFLLGAAIPGGVPERFLWMFMVLPSVPDLFSWMKRRPDVKPEAIARHFAALHGYECPLVEHQIFGPASGRLFIGSEANTLDILELDKLTSVELTSSKASFASRDLTNLKAESPPITKLKLIYARDHDAEYTLTLPTDHAEQLYDAIVSAHPNLLSPSTPGIPSVSPSFQQSNRSV